MGRDADGAAQDAAHPTRAAGRQREHYESRSLLVARLAQQLSHDAAPRLHLSIILVLAGGAAFLCSVLLLWSGTAWFDNMSIRYATAALFGYLAFLLLIRLWIRLHQPASNDDSGLNPLDIADGELLLPRPAGGGGGGVFGGGRSGGGGSSASWGSADTASAGTRLSGGGGWDLDLDPGDAIWLVVLVGCVVGGGLAIVYVIYMAPVLLAEIALDAAILSALYRRLRRDEAGHWLGTVVARTWIPALVVVLFMAVAGFAMTKIAPEAKSIGGVIADVMR